MRILVLLITTASVVALALSTSGCQTGTGDRASDGDDGRGTDATSTASSTAATRDVATDPLDGSDGADDAAGGQPSATQPEVAAALNDFAASEGIAASSVHVVAVTPVTWPDSSLGCASPGEMYTQALVPGYEVRLSSGDLTAVYHTNRGLSGAIALRRCGDSALVAPSDDPAILERIRGDLAERVASGSPSGSAPGSAPASEPVLERSGPAGATSLVCAGTPEAPSSGGDFALQLAVSEVVFRVGADRHVYRIWNGQFVYCGIAPPEEPPRFGTPTAATD